MKKVMNMKSLKYVTNRRHKDNISFIREIPHPQKGPTGHYTTTKTGVYFCLRKRK
jgi:hypothetical protein